MATWKINKICQLVERKSSNSAINCKGKLNLSVNPQKKLGNLFSSGKKKKKHFFPNCWKKTLQHLPISTRKISWNLQIGHGEKNNVKFLDQLHKKKTCDFWQSVMGKKKNCEIHQLDFWRIAQKSSAYNVIQWSVERKKIAKFESWLEKKSQILWKLLMDCGRKLGNLTFNQIKIMEFVSHVFCE